VRAQQAEAPRDVPLLAAARGVRLRAAVQAAPQVAQVLRQAAAPVSPGRGPLSALPFSADLARAL
jgi:hypothetical protein